MEEVGWAALGIIPTLDRRFDSRLSSALGPSLDRHGRIAGSRFGSAFSTSFGTVAGVGLTAATVGLVKNSVTLEASYSKTMRQIGVATNAPEKRLERLDQLAMDLGADTVFSANEASSAMLELAKNGLKPATIEAGALEQALTLATAGDVPLEQAAQVMGNALNAFGLKGKDARQVAAALAGAANASSASVGDLALGLQQAAAGAADAGLTVQETTAGLAAFANAGISGSDAGTSLKTMLSRLVPQTKKAREEMRDLGLDFTDAQGEFLPLADIADQLQTKLSGLSAEERTSALSTIFGSDARRAATILMNEGRAGIEKYTKATSDQRQAEELAKTAMEGTSGSIERLRGSAETAQLQLGKGLAPVVEDVTDGLSDMIDSGDFEQWGSDIGSGLRNIVEDYAPLAGELKDLGQELLPTIGTAMGVTRDALEIAAPRARDLVEAFNDAPEWVQTGGGLAILAGLVGKKTGAFKLFQRESPFGKVWTEAKPLPVFVTNPGFGAPTVDADGNPIVADPDGKPDKKPRRKPKPKPTPKGGLVGATLAYLLGPDIVDEAVAEITWPFTEGPLSHGTGEDITLPNIDDFNRQIRGDRPLEEERADLAGLLLLGDNYEEKLDRIAAKKVQPALELFGLDAADAEVDRHKARWEEPVLVNVIARALDGFTGQAGDALEGFLGGGGSSAPAPKGRHTPSETSSDRGTGRGGPLINIERMEARDYRDMMRQLQHRTQQAGIGGIGLFPS